MVSLRAPSAAVDFAALADLSRALARYHGDAFEPDAERLAADYGRWYEALIADDASGHPVGFAAYYRFYATERAVRGIELQNLFVDARHRRGGAGRQLVAAIARVALTDTCEVLRIGVRKDNTPAIAFYQRLGCTLVDRGRTWACRLDRDAMHRLVALPEGVRPPLA